MKEKITNFTFCLILFISLYFIFKHNLAIKEVIMSASTLFFEKVFVSLFPMFILNDLLIWSNFPFYFALIFNKLFQKLFKTSGLCSYVFTMSLISGTPSNAYILKNLVNNNSISVLEANHYLYFTYFSNPLFLVSMLSLSFNFNIVLKIILIHYFSNLIIAFLLRNKAPKITNGKLNIKKIPLSNTLINSINRTINTLLMVLGTLIFYMLLNFIITNLIPTKLLTKTLIGGFLEITNGLNLLKNLTITLKLKEIIAGFIISFGGLSINTQIKALLEDTDISYTPFLKGRIYQALITVFLLIIF